MIGLAMSDKPFSFIVLAVALLAMPLNAACGGGGFKVSPSTAELGPVTTASTTSIASDWTQLNLPAWDAGLGNQQAQTSASSGTRSAGRLRAVSRAASVIPAPQAIKIENAMPIPFHSKTVDAIVFGAELSEEQIRELFGARASAIAQQDKLIAAQTAARQRFDRCEGDCTDAYRRLKKANEDLKAFDPNIEFERLANLIFGGKKLGINGAKARNKLR